MCAARTGFDQYVPEGGGGGGGGVVNYGEQHTQYDFFSINRTVLLTASEKKRVNNDYCGKVARAIQNVLQR